MKSHEKKAFAAANEVKALAEQRTGLQLPFAQGATWYMTGGPHGWAGSDRPYSSMDLSGGDQKVVAARSGNVYTMCSNNLGWIRVVHDNGYSTDYYHLWDNIKPADGTRMPARSSVTPAPMSPVVVARTGAMSISPSSITAVMCRYMKKR
ncbi:hypothetical protein [Laceyella putida]|uniref:Uncharacterized protein n=1 Tax=Laceyella putida TaxID=110101 RepID=A0ABW2RLD2_9BACL